MHVQAAHLMAWCFCWSRHLCCYIGAEVVHTPVQPACAYPRLVEQLQSTRVEGTFLSSGGGPEPLLYGGVAPTDDGTVNRGTAPHNFIVPCGGLGVVASATCQLLAAQPLGVCCV